MPLRFVVSRYNNVCPYWQRTILFVWSRSRCVAFLELAVVKNIAFQLYRNKQCPLCKAVLNFITCEILHHASNINLIFYKKILQPYTRSFKFTTRHALPSNQKTVLGPPSTTACEMFALNLHIRRPYPVQVRQRDGDKTQVCNTSVHMYTFIQNFSVCVDISLWFGWRR